MTRQGRREYEGRRPALAADSANAGVARGARVAGVPIEPSTDSVLALQRSAGNTAVVTMLRAQGLVPLTEAARKLGEAQAARASRGSGPDVRYRVPTGADLKSLQSSGLLDEADLEEAVRRALRRMDLDFALRTGAEDVMGRLFPGHGAFDEAAAASIFGTSPADVYGSVAQEEAKPKPEDKARLKAVGRLALREMEAAKNDDEGLREVFGTKASIAKARYAKGKAALSKALAHIDTAFDVDYNRDADQSNLSGWAMFSKQHIHLLADIAQVKDRNDSIITLIHESMHLADPDVGDHGYYGEPGFEAKREKTKVNNAAHYEEIPRRNLGMSLYGEHPGAELWAQTYKKFKPGVTSVGTSATFEDHVREDVDTYLNQAWDSALDVLDFVRGVARDILASPHGGHFAANKAELLAISKKEGLTIHKQKPHPRTVTTLDVALSEGVARAAATIWGAARDQPPPTGSDRKAAVNAMINGAIGSYGALLDSPTEDRKLMDWLVAHYKVPW